MSCTKCLNHIEHKVEEVQYHLYRHGIDISYTKWTKHGEEDEPSISAPKPVNATTEFVDDIDFAYIPIDGTAKSRMVESISEDLRWHATQRITDGVLHHPVDSQAWGTIDEKFPEIAEDTRNLWLGIMADGVDVNTGNRHHSDPLSAKSSEVSTELFQKAHLYVIQNTNEICTSIIDGVSVEAIGSAISKEVANHETKHTIIGVLQEIMGIVATPFLKTHIALLKLCTYEEIDMSSLDNHPKSLLKWYHYLSDEYKDNGRFWGSKSGCNESDVKPSWKDIEKAKTLSTPMEKPISLCFKDADFEDVDEYLYRSMIGSLMYLTSSRPDIMFVDSPFDLVAYTDSDYAGASLDRKSTIRGCQFLGCRLISWQCKKQTMVANSTTKAEYIAASDCYGQVLWIQNQLLDYGYNFMQTKIHIDKESTICIVKNPVFHSKTKHIEIRHHFIRDSNEKKLI
ncbi:putative ribonuclease H-like domain-containing protein [Tanacetum coccineum]